MKKQFFRVKQLADQTFSRAGKTEALSDDLQDAEKRVEFIRSACLNIGKKLAVSSTSHDSKEKRLKKNPEYNLGTFMLEITSSEEDHLLRQVVTHCGKLQTCLAKVIVDHEVEVESDVITPLLNVCETDYPNIMKQKRNLTKLILDMDSLKTRYQTASRHSGSTPSSKIKDELEDAESKVEQARETLACDMLQLISRESELSSIILEYAKLQKKYHEAAFKIVDQIIPEMEMAIKDSKLGPVFGTPLEEHLSITGRKIAYPIELCVCGLMESGIAEEGIFRVTPGASKVRRMKVSLDANCMDLETALQFRDPHIFAGVLKLYLRELPEPLLTHKLYDQWMEAARILYNGNSKEGLQSLWSVLHDLPQANLDNLHYLVKFLTSLASKQHTNRMTPQNLAIVIAPNLIWSPTDDSNIGLNMNTANLHSIIVESLVSHSAWFFPGDVDFYVTISRDLALLNGHNLDNQSDIAPGDMKRTQSNSSLSDQNSPPHGSPKPAIRARKHKPAAPNPPVLQIKEERSSASIEDKIKDRGSKDYSSFKEDKNEKGKDKGSKELVPKEGKEKEDKSLKENKCLKEEPISVCSDKLGLRKVAKEDTGKDKCHEDNRQTNPEETTLFETESKNALECKKELSEEARCAIEQVPFEKIPDKVLTERMLKSENEHFRVPSGELDRRTSKSGEDLRKTKPHELYSTLERKKPPRPTPAPRTLLETTSVSPAEEGSSKKPAVPERPANLKRPHSSSFRIPRTLDSEPTTDKESPVENQNACLERTHIFTIDKQQVAFTNVNNEKLVLDQKQEKERIEKPEKPKKPESLVNPPGHHRASSEGSIIDTGVGYECVRGIGRPPRPTPPPPPPIASKRESTDL